MRKVVKIGMVVAGFFALAVTIAFSFFAPGLAIISGVLTVALALVWADYQRRSVWEGKASKDIDILKTAMRRVSDDLGGVRGEVDSLKKSVRSQRSNGTKRTADSVRAEKVAAAVLRQDQPEKKVVRKTKAEAKVKKRQQPKKKKQDVKATSFSEILRMAEERPVPASRSAVQSASASVSKGLRRSAR